MTTLHLGVNEKPYGNNGSGNNPKSAVVTTGDVAEILEEKYGLMQAFFNANEAKIADELTDSVAVALENLLSGSPFSNNIFGDATDKIEEMFKDFISSGEAEKVGIPGTPTGAAMKGVNHRLKHPYAKANRRRPSFKDTGLFEGAFRCWVE